MINKKVKDMSEKEAREKIKKRAKEHRQKNPLLNPVLTGKERDQKFLDVAQALGIQFGTLQFDQMRKWMQPLPGFKVKRRAGDKWKSRATKEFNQQWEDWNTLAVVGLKLHEENEHNRKKRNGKIIKASEAAELSGIPKSTFSRIRKRNSDRWESDHWEQFESDRKTCEDFIAAYQSKKASEEADRKEFESMGKMNVHQAFAYILEKGEAEEAWLIKHKADQEKLKKKLKIKS